MTKIEAPADGNIIVYYGDLNDPDHLRKVVIRPTRALMSARMGLSDPKPPSEAYVRARANVLHIGELIPEDEEQTMREGVRALGGRTTSDGGRFRHTGDISAILALAASLWGEPVGTATQYGQLPVQDLTDEFIDVVADTAYGAADDHNVTALNKLLTDVKARNVTAIMGKIDPNQVKLDDAEWERLARLVSMQRSSALAEQ